MRPEMRLLPAAVVAVRTLVGLDVQVDEEVFPEVCQIGEGFEAVTPWTEQVPSWQAVDVQYTASYGQLSVEHLK